MLASKLVKDILLVSMGMEISTAFMEVSTEILQNIKKEGFHMIQP
jgi:hypothetical protein